MSDLLFVYGSLRSEFDNPHARKLRADAVLLGPATVRGSLFHVAGYSGYQKEPDGLVYGEIWQLGDPSKTLNTMDGTLVVLDNYEGTEYVRVLVDLVEPAGRSAWIYMYNGKPDSSRRILSGDVLKP